MATCDPWKISHPGTHWLDYVDNSIILMVQEIVTSWHIGWRKKPHCFSTILTSYVWKVSEFPGCKIRWKNLLSRVSRCVFLGPIGEYDFVKIVKATVWQIRRFQTESSNITGRVRLKKWFVILLLPVVFRWWRLPQKSNFSFWLPHTSHKLPNQQIADLGGRNAERQDHSDIPVCLVRTRLGHVPALIVARRKLKSGEPVLGLIYPL